ncbi:MAG: dihydroorotase [Bdellovibrionales bacterium CG10_big_fil_rev_8_21_14_0_10_45_34]|nr:MAG: dihydroorotase [Bdellovibrionales bacterium CG10_big_fil_rev_8_21_14_0_10_45_34]
MPTDTQNRTFDLVLENITVLLNGRLEVRNIGVSEGKIASLDANAQQSREKRSMKGLVALPGAIDTQVHFRDPGFPEKETLQSGTRAAVIGGITAVFEMPNTNPATISSTEIAKKCQKVQQNAWCDIAFYVGATRDNLPYLSELERLEGVCGVKSFLGSSTGNLLLENPDDWRRLMQSTKGPLAFHSENEALLKLRKAELNDCMTANVNMHPIWRNEEVAFSSTKRLIEMAREQRRKVHVLHVTTQEEMEFLHLNKDICSVETTPQHLTLVAPECYERLGTLAQMNPPIRSQRHYDALWKAVANGTVDILGSDHAPHTLEEKRRAYPNSPSGMTGVQTLLFVMLNHVNKGRLSLQRLVDMVSLNPAKRFCIKGKGPIALGRDADFTIVDLKKKFLITNPWIESNCGWTPFDGMTVEGSPVATMIRGRLIVEEGAIATGGPTGSLLSFNKWRPEKPNFCDTN